jgi:hypothetical protein
MNKLLLIFMMFAVKASAAGVQEIIRTLHEVAQVRKALLKAARGDSVLPLREKLNTYNAVVGQFDVFDVYKVMGCMLNDLLKTASSPLLTTEEAVEEIAHVEEVFVALGWALKIRAGGLDSGDILQRADETRSRIIFQAFRLERCLADTVEAPSPEMCLERCIAGKMVTRSGGEWNQNLAVLRWANDAEVALGKLKKGLRELSVDAFSNLVLDTRGGEASIEAVAEAIDALLKKLKGLLDAHDFP